METHEGRVDHSLRLAKEYYINLLDALEQADDMYIPQLVDTKQALRELDSMNKHAQYILERRAIDRLLDFPFPNVIRVNWAKLRKIR
jgi:hypothetical protein